MDRRVGGYSLYQFAELAVDGGSFFGGGDEGHGCEGVWVVVWMMGFKQLVV